VSEVSLRVNGRSVRVTVSEEEMLLDTLRRLDLTSVREGCGVGACGACTVLVRGLPLSSCLVRSALAEGAEVLTLEGVGEDDSVRAAFREREAFQCGYCTPGFIMMARALLAELPDAGDEELEEYLAGNLCRCGAYPEIKEAVRSAQGNPRRR
jgi:aerobic-type carbon monoxide dehydrogenase small subunit (CoxS/CutS family)